MQDSTLDLGRKKERKKGDMDIRHRLAPILLFSMVSGLQAATPRHPGYQLVDIPLRNFNLGITGMDFLPDGRMVITTYRGDTAKSAGGVAFGRTTWGQAYILENVQGEPRDVTHTLIADKFLDAMGVEVVDGKIYIGEIDRIIRLADADGDGFFETKETVAELPADDANLAYSYGPLHKDGYLYMALGSPVSFRSTDRGTVVRVPVAGGRYEVVATGLRSPNGIGLGPDREIVVTDNQGNWRPVSILTHIRPGSFYGFSLSGPRGEVTPPTLQLPYQVFNNSPTEPVYLTSGRYAGQFIYGDWAKRNLYRAFVETVDGMSQGAAFFFTGGLKSPVSRIVVDGNGVLYLGQMTLAFGPNGPQKLVPRPEAEVFEMLAVRSRRGGLEIEFTQPVGPMAEQDSLFTLEHWHYTPTGNYFNGPMDVAPLPVANVQVSADRRRVYLELDGMKAGKVVHIKAGSGLRSGSDQALWTDEAYYTLNAISGTQPLLTASAPPTAAPSALAVLKLAGGLAFQWKDPGYSTLSLHTLRGSALGTFDVAGLKSFRLPEFPRGQGLVIARLQGRHGSETAKVMLPSR